MTTRARVDVRAVEVDPSSDERWDAYVAQHPQGRPFHRSAWLRTLQAEYRQRPIGLAAEDAEGSLVGVLPLMATRGLPGALGVHAGRQRLSSLPRTPAAGPIADDDATTALLLGEAMARTPSGAQLQIKLTEPSLDGLGPGLVGHPWRMNYTVTLPESADNIRFGPSRHHTRVVAASHKAAQKGMSIRAATSLDEVRSWYRLYLETMRFHLVPPRSFRLFEAMWRELRPLGMMELLLVERHGVLEAGNVLVSDGTTAFYLFNGAAREALVDRPNDMLQVESIRRLTESGHQLYDLGEVVEGHEGLRQFKRKWGAEERRMHRYYWPAPDSAPNPGDDESGRARATAERLYQRLPLRATAVAGSLVYRFL